MAEVQSFLTGNGDERQTLVVVFLRGGADGLNLIAPLEDDGYHRSRPRIAIGKKECVTLDGFYGMNPLLQPLERAFKDGALAIVHAAGSEDDTRSHFEAQDLMEHGGITSGGWLGRFLRVQNKLTNGPLTAVALGKAIPECLRGAPATTVLQSLEDFSLGNNRPALTTALARLYGLQSDVLAAAGRDTLNALQRVEQFRTTSYHPAHGAEYGRDDFSRGLLEVARLIKARVGLRAASVDLGGWDSHFSQSLIMDPLIVRLAKGLAAFYQDLGTEIQHTTVVVMTEFGRRVEENSAFGTDHGRGSVMFVLGGGVKGGRVLGQWPGLSREVLEGPGDLPVTTNYRNVLAPILQRHGANGKLGQVFPDFVFEPLPVYG
jgi:uncharacterized protein (DUF1501 family)